MKSSGSNTSQSAGRAPESDIPPPLDPFPTYQTPYPRNDSDRDNPFVSFRRFADEQLSSFFSGLPRLLGVPADQSASGQVSRDRATALERLFSEQATRFETEITEMLRKQNENAEGIKKQMEQEWEERRRENESRLEEDDKRWDMLKKGLHTLAWLKPDISNHSTVSSPRNTEPVSASSDSTVVFNQDQPATELDMYERFEDQIQDRNLHQPSCPWSRHRERGEKLGWDGRCRTRKTLQSNTETETAQDSEDERDDLFRWLLTSRYSPFEIERPGRPVAQRSVPDSLASGVKSTPSDTDDFSPFAALDRKLAEHLPWTEAFVDLLNWQGRCEMASEEKTVQAKQQQFPLKIGEEVDRLRHVTGALADTLLESVLGFPTGPFGRTDQESEQNSEDATELLEDHTAASKAFGARGITWPMPEAVLASIDYLEKAESRKGLPQDHISGQNADDSDTWSPISSIQSKAESGLTNSVVSTLTTTQIRTLPDGSTETRRILKRRFADGCEESSESVETRPVAPKAARVKQDQHDTLHKQTQTSSDVSETGKGRGGWFWN